MVSHGLPLPINCQHTNQLARMCRDPMPPLPFAKEWLKPSPNMNKPKPSKARIQTTLVAALGALLLGVIALTPGCADQSAATGTAATAATRHPLTGAELYSIHCNRCHPERYPTERTAAQWKTITLHMQIRAGIPGTQARLILKYLQDNSGR